MLLLFKASLEKNQSVTSGKLSSAETIQPVKTDTKQTISSLISNSHSFVNFLRKTCGERRRSEFFQH